MKASKNLLFNIFTHYIYTINTVAYLSIKLTKLRLNISNTQSANNNIILNVLYSTEAPRTYEIAQNRPK